MSVFAEVEKYNRYTDEILENLNAMTESTDSIDERIALTEMSIKILELAKAAIKFEFLKIDYKQNPEFDIKKYIED